MNEIIKDVLEDRAEHARTPQVDTARLIRAGRRRRWRNRAVGGTSVAAALAAVALVVPLVPHGTSDDAPTAGMTTDGDTDGVTYALDTTIYSGDEQIDVSPYQVYDFVRTDEGFAFVAGNGNVYFTDGSGVEQIGSRANYHQLEADDSGSYVGWVEGNADGPDDTVVYDTGRETEVLRTSVGNQRGCWPDDPTDNSGVRPRVDAIDGETAYVCNANGVIAWDLSTEDDRWISPARTISGVVDVSDGWLVEPIGHPSVPVISRDPGVDGPRFPGTGDLSPNADYVLGETDDGEVKVVERTTRLNVTPDVGDYDYEMGLQWIDDDRLLVEGMPDIGDPNTIDLLVCSLSAGDCTVAVSDLTVENGELTLPSH
jgi:hypothetical protein